jgi:ABC-2 type transport system ATP-binding protein
MSASDTIVHGLAEVSSSALLQVRSLGKRYGHQHALLDVSFEARACEVIGLIGPNGAGKTTLLEALSGVLPADQGEVL